MEPCPAPPWPINHISEISLELQNVKTIHTKFSVTSISIGLLVKVSFSTEGAVPNHLIATGANATLPYGGPPKPPVAEGAALMLTGYLNKNGP